MVNTYHKQKGHKFLTNLTNSEYLAFLYSDHNKERAQQIKLMQKRGMIMRRKNSLSVLCTPSFLPLYPFISDFFDFADKHELYRFLSQVH